MNSVDSAVRHWQRRVGPCGAFDADDARQEAAIACWQTGKDMAVVGYRGILSAMRRLVPGFRQRDQIIFCEIEDTRRHEDTPEAILSAWQTIDAIERGDKPRPVAALAPDPLHDALKAEALEASRLFDEAMRTLPVRSA